MRLSLCRFPHESRRARFYPSIRRAALSDGDDCLAEFGHKPMPSRCAAPVIVLAGIMLTAADSFSRGPQLTRTLILGHLLFLFSVVHHYGAAFTLLLGRYAVTSPCGIGATTCGGALVCLPVWWFFLSSTFGHAPVSEIAAQALYQGLLVVFVAMLLYTFAVRRLGTQTVALLMAFVPVLSALAAVPLLREALSETTLAGLAAVTAGAVLGVRPHSLLRLRASAK
jgi:drug/metabolite transporter (DMT)-like permease